MAHVAPTPMDERRGSGPRVVAFLLIGLLVGLWALNAGPVHAPARVVEVGVDPAVATHSYMARFGGSEQVYDRISNTSDCGVLERDLELATNHKEQAKSGSVERSWTVGYITAAGDRMAEIGCAG